MSQAGVAVHQALKFVSCYVFHFLLQRTDLVLHIQNVLLGGHQFFVNGVMTVDILVLGQITDLLILGNDHLTGIRGNLLHDNTKKSCFPRTVIADESGLFPFFYVKRSILQDHLFPKRFADALT